MIGGGRHRSVALLVCAWTAAAAARWAPALMEFPLAVLAFALVFIVPGLQLARLLEAAGVALQPARLRPVRILDWRQVAEGELDDARQRRSPLWRRVLTSHDTLERVIAGAARAFADSLGALTFIGILVWIVGGSADVVLALLSGFSIAAAATATETPPEEVEAAHRIPEQRANAWKRWSGPGFWALAAVTVVLMLQSVGDANVARDRTWYLAYVTAIAGGDTLSWAEPFFGSERMVPRFAFNPWLLGLGVVTRLGDFSAALVFERVAPLALTPLLVSASVMLGRTLFGRTRAIVPALAAVLIAASSAYPHFAPEAPVLFARLAEDKTVALLVLLPVVWSTAIETVVFFGATPAAKRLGAAGAVLAFAALAATHSMVFALALVGIAGSGLWMASSRKALRPAVATVLLIASLVALPAGLLGLAARDHIRDDGAVAATLENPRHPVVRAHLRMDRTVQVGDHVATNPALLADAPLMLAMLGLVVAALRRKTAWGAFLIYTSLPVLAVAFVPPLASAFGSLVLPWFAYRALWGVPFGMALAALVLEGPALLFTPRPSRALAAAALGALALATTVHRLPWQRLDPFAERPPIRLDRHPDVATLADLVDGLPDNAVVAASREASEALAAVAGTTVVGLPDRTTWVFASSPADARARLEALAVLVALPGAPAPLRAAVAGEHGVTHVVRKGGACADGETELRRIRGHLLCTPPQLTGAVPSLARVTATTIPPSDEVPGVGTAADAAAIGPGLECSPQGVTTGGASSWKRESRWSARPLVVRCSGTVPVGDGPLSLLVRLNLPRAREVLVVAIDPSSDARFVVSGDDARRDVERGADLVAVRFDGSQRARIALEAKADQEIAFDLAPAFLPYLNVLELRLERG